ncbi:hypothetical protein [Hydrogenophaga sp.]|uniref:hypothetical protein n=1 Tax=Hydrogenophaga sp. TaxID=1904254 RepID=UPI002724DEC1|nr:hypothetical protein [Hydrogenophaga sp.]MDO9435032.1 hypothetical protein [Hydrogenophaga sp.]
MHIHAISAAKRPLENTADGEQPAKASRVQTPEEILASLNSLIVDRAHPSFGNFLTTLACFDISRLHFDQPAREFSRMIFNGEYALFVATFKLFNQLKENAAEADGCLPYKSVLTLRAPSHWTPDPDKLCAALRQVKVDRLAVSPELPSYGAPRPIPAAVGLCVSTLLNAGTTELHIEGCLDEPDVIASAVSTSSLRWMAFTSTSLYALSAKDIEGYRKIMAALASCSTLKHLSVGPHQLLALHSTVGGLQKDGGPQLVSVGLGMGNALVDDIEINVDAPHTSDNFLAFMNAVGKIPTLAVCRMRKIQFQDIASLEKYILAPLAQSRSLIKLDLQCNLREVSTETRLLAAPTLIAFKARCPSLIHLRCDAGPSCDLIPAGWAGRVFDQYLQAGESRKLGDATKAMAAVVAQPDFNLQSLDLNGLHISLEVGHILSGALARNTSLLRLDLRRCSNNLRLASRLIADLKSNDTIESVILSTDLKYWYVLVEGEQGPMAVGFSSFRYGLSARDQLDFLSHRNLPPAYADSIRAALPDLHQLGQKLFEVVEEKPVANQRRALMKVTYPTLTGPVQALMSAALVTAPGYAPVGQRSDAPEAFSIPAQLVVEYLSEQKVLNTAVHVARINTATDVDGRREKGTTHAPEVVLQQLVRLQNKDMARAVKNNLLNERARRDRSWQTDFSHDVTLPEEPLNLQPPGPLHVLLRNQLSDLQLDLFIAATNAIATGDARSLVLAIAVGAPVNVVDASTRNVLMVMAATSGIPELVRVLLESGAKDFGGYGLLASKSRAVFELLRSPTTGRTTTNTTITTTTASTAMGNDNRTAHAMPRDPEEDPDNVL